jgi:hypothetical protein
MKAHFRGWYARSPSELREIWRVAIFVPDANILLHMLRHKKDVRNRLIRAFESTKDNIWIPYQIGLEFHRNRLAVDRQATDAYDKLTGAANRAIATLEQQLKEMRAHPYIDIDVELRDLADFTSRLRKRMEALKAAHSANLMLEGLESVSAIFEGKVGDKPTAEVLGRIRREADERYPKKIPPGYMDASKDAGGDRHGDLVIWKELIRIAKLREKPVIFITDDEKEDWWQIHSGKKLGPRPELVEEFFEATGQDFYLYTLSGFLEHTRAETGLAKEDVQLVEQSIRRDLEARATAEVSSAAEDQQRQILRARIRSLSVMRDNLRMSLLEREFDSVKRAELKDELMAVQTDLEAAQQDFDALTTDRESVTSS